MNNKQCSCLCGAASECNGLCTACSSKTFAIGRILLALIFIMSGFGKLMDFAGTVAWIDSAGFPAATLLAVAAVIIELGGGLALLVGACTRSAAIALIVFLVAATLMFHLDFSEQMQQIAFLKNLAILGGLLYVLGAGPGAWALGGKKRHHEETQPEQV